jgi:hypothetical protein
LALAFRRRQVLLAGPGGLPASEDKGGPKSSLLERSARDFNIVRPDV